MKNITPDSPLVTVSLVCNYDLTFDELDAVLAQPEEKQYNALNDLMDTKHPNRESSDYNLKKVKEAYGNALVQHREKSFKQLTAPSPQPNESV